MMDPNQMPQGMPQGMPEAAPMAPPLPEMPPVAPLPEPSVPDQPLPEFNPPTNKESKGDGLKKQLLQKLMSNLLNKPGRSMHEMINGIKDAISAYKNYAKEWDSLNGISPDGGASTEPSLPSTGGSGSDIQKILQGIQTKKDGGGGHGIRLPQDQPVPQLPPTTVPGSGYRTPPPVNSLGIFGY